MADPIRLHPRPRRFLLPTMLAAVLNAGCQTVEVVVPKVEQVQSVEISNTEDLATIGLDRVAIKIRRGTPIGTYDPDFLGFTGCYGLGGNVFWNQGRVLARDLELSDLFYEEMKTANFNVTGNPDKMFSSESENRKNVRYLVGGQIEKIALNACREKDFWTGGPRITTRGKGAITVKWQVFSTLERKVVYEASTEGAASIKTGVPGGELVIIQEAFANAVQNLTGDADLVALLSKGAPSIADIKNVEGIAMTIDKLRPRSKAITETIDNTRLAVVTIEGDRGHGSGFFFSPSLIMTNSHVVENAQFVRVQLLTGRRILGEVVRKHPKRDVAVVQVEPAGVPPIPIQTEPLKITQAVYAIGSPLHKELSGTVTKGIVSKFIPNRFGMEDIQADVDIQGGNSGGVLLDASGNVVGVSYAGIGPGGNSVGLNFFIPIMDALTKLNIEIASRRETS